MGLAELEENQPFDKMKKFIKVSTEFFLIGPVQKTDKSFINKLKEPRKVKKNDEPKWQLWSKMPEEKPLQKLIEKRLSELVQWRV